jgi:hypothetical protein
MPKPVIDRLMSKVIKQPNGCHEWTGARRGTMGYSTLGNEPGKLPKMLYGHVVAYEHHKGTIPSGMVVRHACDNPVCVNPEHLTIGSHSDNHGDMMERGRGGDYKPHKVTEDIVRTIRASGESLSVLSARHGLSVAQVSKIRNHKAWKHI